MATSNCPSIGTRDSLHRDDLIPPGVVHGRLVVKLVIGALIGLLLALAGNLSEPRQDSSDPLVKPWSTDSLPSSPWGEAGGR